VTLDARKQCAVCAWRETCQKKFTIKESSPHCADFSRDRTLPEEEVAGGRASRSMKKIDDVFGDS